LHPEVEVVKRVIGLEGDIVYTRAPYPYPTAKVPEGHIWVEGDGGANGKQSLDSNTYGPVSMSLVTGKITHVLWPWASFGRVNYEDWRGKTKVIKAKAKRQEPLHWS
jgi:inner membrane protease subunit 2